MLKSPHAVKLVGTLFIAFSFFVVYSTFSENSLFTGSWQGAQLVCIPPPGSVTCYNPTLPPGPVFSAASCVRYTIQDSGLTFLRYPDNFSSAYQIYPASNAGSLTQLSLGGGKTLSVINQYTPSVLQNIRARFILTGTQALGNCPYVGAISLYINGTSFVPKAGLIPGPYVPPEQYGYYSVQDSIEFVPLVTLLSESKTESLIEDIDRDKQINMTIDPNYDYRYSPADYNNYFTPPMSNCVYIKAASGTPKDTIILTRDSRSGMTLPDFLSRVSSSDGATASTTFSYYLDLKKRDQTTFLKTQSSCNTIVNPEYVFLGDTPRLTSVVVATSTRSVAISGSWFLNKYNDIRLTRTGTPAQEYILQNVASANNKNISFTPSESIPGGNYTIQVRTFGGGWSNALPTVLPSVVDVCTPTISAPAFDSVYITNTKTSRGFTPALPVTPFDNFYVDFNFEASCPASRVAQMTPSLTLTISDNLVKVLKTGSITRQGSTNTYRWSLMGWPNGIISDQALLVELLEHSAFSLPVTVELNEGGSIKSLATKDINMTSCVQVYGSSGPGQIPFVFMGAERLGDVGIDDRGVEGTELLTRSISTKNALFSTDPFKKYKDKFVLFADLKPVSFGNDWNLVYNRLKTRPGYYDAHILGHSDWIAREISSCKFDVRNYLIFGDKEVRAAAWGDNANGVAMPNLAYVRKLPSPIQEQVNVHEIGHSFASLDDEYVLSDNPYASMDKNIGANCTSDPTSRYFHEGKQYAELDVYGCNGSLKYNKPTSASIMDASYSSAKFNKISCAYIIRAIKGGEAKNYYAECAGLDVVDPGENIPGVPITVLTQQTDEVWLSGNSYEVRWLMPANYSTVGVEEIMISLIDKDGIVKYSYRDGTDIAVKNFKQDFVINDSLLGRAPPGEYGLRVKIVPKQTGIDTGFSLGKVLIQIAEPAPIVLPSAPNTAPIIPGIPKTINGSGFTPTGNKVQLIKTGEPSTTNGAVSSGSLFDKFRDFAVAITKNTRNSANIANILSGTLARTRAEMITTTTNTYEIKDIPSNGTSLTFTIPSDIPPGVYTMKVAGLNSNYSEGVTITIASPVPAPVLTSLNHTSSIVGSWVIAQGSGFSDSIEINTDKVWFSNASTSVEAVTGISSGTGPNAGRYVDPSIPNLTPGNYSAFKIPNTLAPGVYTVKIARQSSPWSNPLTYTVLPVQNPDGSYNFAHAIASSRVMPTEVSVTMENTDTEFQSDSSDDDPNQDITENTTVVPESRASLIARLLALIQQLTEQLEALKAGKTEIPKIPAVVTPTPLPNVFPTITTVACTQEVNQCPDGSFVGRTPPTCTFQACPTTTLPPAPVFACPTDTQICANGTTVTRTLPTCLFPACPNPFTPPPPVVVTPPPPTITPVVVTPPPPAVTPTPTPTEPTLSAALSSVYEDRAGQWGNFAPGINSQSKANDFVWNATLTLSGSKTIRSININHNVSGEYWSTDNGNAYPLVIFHNNTQLNTAYTQTLGTYGAGANNLVIYGQFENPTFSGGTLTISFTDNTSVTATIPASSFSPCNDCGQTGAVFDAIGGLFGEWWRTVISTFAR